MHAFACVPSRRAAKERGSKHSKATEQMAASMRAFLQRPKQQAPAAAEEKGGVAAAPAGGIDGAGRGLGAAHATGRHVHSGSSGGRGSSSSEEQQSQGPDQAPSSQELWARIMQQGDNKLQRADALWQGMIPKPGQTTEGQPQGNGQPASGQRRRTRQLPYQQHRGRHVTWRSRPAAAMM